MIQPSTPVVANDNWEADEGETGDVEEDNNMDEAGEDASGDPEVLEAPRMEMSVSRKFNK